jgi:ketosteroid isomerase-like protein
MADTRRQPPRKGKRSAAPTQHRPPSQLELDTPHTRVRDPARASRRARNPVRETSLHAARLRSLEAELAALRRELGPQWPLLAVQPAVDPRVRDPWMPVAVERHLTALNDHDLAPLDALLASDVVFTEAPFPQASRRGKAAVTALHADLFATWTDFRFMPRHWHNLGGAAFLEGDASFVQRGQRNGIAADGRPVMIDMLLIYYLTNDTICRIKLYYDAASIRAQLAASAG